MAAVICYHIPGEFGYGLGEPNIPRVLQIIDNWLTNNEHGPMSDAALVLLHAVRGDLDQSHEWCKKFMAYDDMPRKIHFVVYCFEGKQKATAD